MRTRRLVLVAGTFLLGGLVSACSDRKFDDKEDSGDGGRGGESNSETGGASAGGSDGKTGGSDVQDGSGGGSAGLGGSDPGDCSEGERECVDAATLRSCTSEGTWRYDECSSCSNETCFQTITLCTDDKRSSTAFDLEVSCAGVTTVIDFLHVASAPDGCMKKQTALCEAGETVSIAITGASSSYSPEAILIGSNASDGVACPERGTCETVMPDGPLFVRGVACDGDTSDESGCNW